MTRRNYSNERYTADDGKAGVTKKSASKAKLTKGAASTVYVKGTPTKSKKQLRYEKQIKDQKRQEIQDRRVGRVIGAGATAPENKVAEKVKKLRRYWWGCLILAGAFAAGGYFSQGTPFFVACIIGAYASIGLSFYVEFGKIRKVNKENEVNGEKKLTPKRIRHQMEDAQEAKDKKILGRFNKGKEDLADELPFKE